MEVLFWLLHNKLFQTSRLKLPFYFVSFMGREFRKNSAWAGLTWDLSCPYRQMLAEAPLRSQKSTGEASQGSPAGAGQLTAFTPARWSQGSQFLNDEWLPSWRVSQKNQAETFSSLTSDITWHCSHKTQLATSKSLRLGPFGRNIKGSFKNCQIHMFLCFSLKGTTWCLLSWTSNRDPPQDPTSLWVQSTSRN